MAWLVTQLVKFILYAFRLFATQAICIKERIL